MHTSVVKIFLASSKELKDDRREFEIFIGRKNKDLVGRVLFELIVWDDFLDAVSSTRLQDEYNQAIRECDIFVMLFCTKVGQFTDEEFETALRQFMAAKRPRIFTYFKNIQIWVGSAKREDLATLWAFQDRLKNLGHFPTHYKNVDELKLHFDRQLDKLAASGVFPSVASGVEQGVMRELEHRFYWLRDHLLLDPLPLESAWEAKHALDGRGGQFGATDERFREKPIEPLIRDVTESEPWLDDVIQLRRLCERLPRTIHPGEMVDPGVAAKLEDAAGKLPTRIAR